MKNTIYKLSFDHCNGDIIFNDIFIPLNTPLPEFKSKLLAANIYYLEKENTLHFECYEQFTNPKKPLKTHPTKKLSNQYQVIEKNQLLYLVQVLELDIKFVFHFNSSTKFAGMYIEITDRNEDYSSWDTYDIDKCYNTHLDWLNQKITTCQKIDYHPNLSWLSGYLIRDKSENIFWRLDIKQKNRE